MDSLTLFGLFAVTAMLVCYALEDRHTSFILGFAAHARSDRPMVFFKEHGLSDLLRVSGLSWRFDGGGGKKGNITNPARRDSCRSYHIPLKWCYAIFDRTHDFRHG